MSSSKTFCALLSLALLSGCGSSSHEVKKPAEAAPVNVSTITVSTAEWPNTFEATGTVRARTAATISSRMTGSVLDVKVRAGDRIAAGQTLITIDARDLDSGLGQAQATLEEARSAEPETAAAIASAEAQLDLAGTTLRRMKTLLDKQSVSQQEFDEAAARVRVAEAGRGMAVAKRRQLEEKIRQAGQAVQSAAVTKSYAELKAPFAGRVTARRVEPGNMASPGIPLLEIEQEGGFRLEASVGETRLGAVKRGEAVTVKLDALDISLQGRVTEIVPAVEESSRAFTVKIDLPSHPALRTGLFGRAEFAMGQRIVLAVPRTAVLAQGQVVSVMVADSGYARSRLVSLGASRGERVEVLSGLREGDKVIHPRPAGLIDGGRVEVRP